MPEWIKRRVSEPLLKLLKTGLSPAKLAQSVAFGLVIAIFPALGWSTLLCIGAAFSFKLNMVAIQTVNYLAYPLQFLLIIPFIRAGEWLYHEPPINLSPGDILQMIRNNPWQAIRDLWTSTWHAITIWLILAPFVIALLTWFLTPIFERAARRPETQAGA